MKYSFLTMLSVLTISCGTSSTKPTLEGWWECYKIESKNGSDTISDGRKRDCIPDPLVITSNQMAFVITDPVNYVRKDSVIYIKMIPYYKIEKLTKDEMVLLEIACMDKVDCESKEKYDEFDRRYYKKLK